MTDFFRFYIPTRVLFGRGQLSHLHETPLPGKRALLVISNGRSVRESGALERVQRELHLAGAQSVLFDKIQPNPLKETAEEGGRVARESGCDFIVALGGGSVMDACKAIAVAATNPGDLWDYAAGITGKRLPIPNQPLPIVAITTTAGTGSEVDAVGVITNPATHEKIGFGSVDALFPALSIVDPELMRTVPPQFTAFQGFDALFHATECYISQKANLMSDMVALCSIENVGRFLERAVRDGNDMEARERMAFANTLSGMVMTLSANTAKHSIEHAMSAYHPSLPHGAGLIMISLAFYRFFIERHACDERFVAMARALGCPQAKEPGDFLTALEALQKKCGVDALRMSDYGILPNELDAIARNALEAMGKLFAFNPCEMTREDVVAVLLASYR